MERIHYAGDTLLTGTLIAHAVVKYAQALAGRKQVATITIPIRLSDGTLSHATLLIGAGSQLVAEPEVSAFDEIVDATLVDSLTIEAAKLWPTRPVPADFDPDEESSRMDGL